MARREPTNLTVRQSVLDRLLDDEPDPEAATKRLRRYIARAGGLPTGEPGDRRDDSSIMREPAVHPHEAVRRVVQSVRRDLEWLLNTRLTWVNARIAAAEYAARSIATYGLPDYSSENLNDADARGRLKRAIEKAIAIFEPRLIQVAVTAEPLRQHDRTLRFRIDAVLHVDPIREPVTFDTVLDTGGAAQVLEV